MKRILSAWLGFLCCLFICVGSLAAQQATVNHGVSLRGDPSTKNPPIGHLNRNSTVTVLAAKPKAGFYHVQTADGIKGWVGVKYLNVEAQGSAGGPMPTSAGGTLPTPSNQSVPDTSAGSTVAHRSSGNGSVPSTSGAGSSGCDDSLWDYVYHPQRLIVKDKCVAVTGTIVDATNGRQHDGVRHEADGDTHGWLKVDAEFVSLLNAGNKSAEGGNLVFEIVCEFRVTQADAKGTPGCQGYKSKLTIPPVGSHVRIVGRYVQDTNHAKWMEIHPVSSIEVIR